MSSSKVDISHILQGLRGDCDYIQAAQTITKLSIIETEKEQEPIIFQIERAKSFLIYLALDALKVSEKSDIVLCAWGLLKEFQYGKDLTQRRKYYLEQREKYVPDYIYKQPFITFSEAQQKSRADALRVKEDAICISISEYYSSIINKAEYITQAGQAFISAKTMKSGADPVLYPLPSYIRNNGKIVNNLYRQRNLGFMFREDVMSTLTERFSTPNRLIQVLRGVDGVGKTEIAREYAYRSFGKYSAVCWIDATDELTIDKSCQDFLQRACPDQLGDRNDSTRIRFLNYFSIRSDWLIVFDNAEYMDTSDSESYLSEVLLSFIPSGNGHIIITTHNSGDFEGAEQIEVKEFDQDTAVCFLASKANIKPDRSLELLVNELGRLPQALTAAASYIRQQKVSAFEYLKLWQKYGVSAFGKKSASIIKNTYRIILDKNDDSIPEELATKQLLQLCSVLSSESITLSLFYNRADKIDPDYEGEDELPYPLCEIIEDEIQRRDLLSSAMESSLLYWDGTHISMNPIVQEAICDEMDSEDLNYRLVFAKIVTEEWMNDLRKESYNERFTNPLLPEVLLHIQSILKKTKKYADFPLESIAGDYFVLIRSVFFAESDQDYSIYPINMSGYEVPLLKLICDYFDSYTDCEIEYRAYIKAMLANSYRCGNENVLAIKYTNESLNDFDLIKNTCNKEIEIKKKTEYESILRSIHFFERVMLQIELLKNPEILKRALAINNSFHSFYNNNKKFNKNLHITFNKP